MDFTLAWHFLPEDGKLANGDGRTVVAGETYRVDAAKIKLCEFGLHASIRAIDALAHAPGPVICRVTCAGTILSGTDKLVCSERRVIWLHDATKILHLFACEVAERALLFERERGREPDRRLFDAILTKRSWLAGKATDAELSAARSAASAAWSAARSAAWSAAWSATDSAARSAASEAARYAARLRRRSVPGRTTF